MTFKDLFRYFSEELLKRMFFEAHKRELLRAARLPKLYHADANAIILMAKPDVTSLLSAEEMREVLSAIHRASMNKTKGRGAYRAETKTRGIESGFKVMLAKNMHERLDAMLNMDAWPHFAEAMYIYEHQVEAHAEIYNSGFGHLSASERAHWKIADAVGHDNIETIKRWCQTARDERKAGDNQDIKPFPVTRFLQWLKEGGSPLSIWDEAFD